MVKARSGIAFAYIRVFLRLQVERIGRRLSHRCLSDFPKVRKIVGDTANAVTSDVPIVLRCLFSALSLWAGSSPRRRRRYILTSIRFLLCCLNLRSLSEKVIGSSADPLKCSVPRHEFGLLSMEHSSHLVPAICGPSIRLHPIVYVNVCRRRERHTGSLLVPWTGFVG